jgi:DNA polymerase
MSDGERDGGSAVRDFEAYLVALREAFGEDVVADAGGASAPPGRDQPARLQSSGSRLPDPEAEARSPKPGAARSGPGVAELGAPEPAGPPAQTSLLGEEPAPPVVSPGLRRSRGAEPGVVDFRGLPDIVRAPCKPEVRAEALAAIDVQVKACTRCVLHRGRTTTVFGVGHPCARVCFIGEGPGAEEDRRGEPFVGRAGQLLDRIIVAMGLRRSEVYIGNTVKCRPPENRTPYPEEMEACAPYLRGQLEAIAPQVIVALGRPAAQALLAVNSSLGELRGRFHRHRGIPVMVTYHPAYLLRNPSAKKSTWEDVQLVMKFLKENPDPLAIGEEGR